MAGRIDIKDEVERPLDGKAGGLPMVPAEDGIVIYLGVR